MIRCRSLAHNLMWFYLLIWGVFGRQPDVIGQGLQGVAPVLWCVDAFPAAMRAAYCKLRLYGGTRGPQLMHDPTRKAMQKCELPSAEVLRTELREMPSPPPSPVVLVTPPLANQRTQHPSSALASAKNRPDVLLHTQGPTMPSDIVAAWSRKSLVNKSLVSL